jgi:ABC-type oligopeptide transport system substrate-binding subunit
MERAPNEPFSVYPRLARKVYLSPQRDFITFYLDPRARFHDGTPVTAQDVVFTFNVFATEGTIARRMMAQKVKEVRQDGPLQVTFFFHPLAEGGYDRELPLVIAGLPVLSKKHLKGKAFGQTGLSPLMGSGPYRIAEVKAGEKIVYQRDPHYWGQHLPALKGLYNFDRIVYEYYGSNAAAFEAFKKGDITYWTETNLSRWMTEYTFPAVTHGNVLKETMGFTDAALVTTLVFNNHRGALKDPLVRRACGILFDLHWINKNLFYQTLQPTSSFFAGTSFEARGLPDAEEKKILQKVSSLPESVWKPLPTWPEESTAALSMREKISQAHALLKQAGWFFDPSSQHWVKGEEVLSLELLLNDPQNERLALAYQMTLKKAGIVLHIHTVDSAQYQKRLDERLFDLIFFTYGTGMSPGREQKLYWMSAFAKIQSRNYGGIESSAIDQVCDLLVGAETPKQVETCMRVLDRLLRHGWYMRPLYCKNTAYYAHWKGLAHPPYDGKINLSLYSWWAEGEGGK